MLRQHCRHLIFYLLQLEFPFSNDNITKGSMNGQGPS